MPFTPVLYRRGDDYRYAKSPAQATQLVYEGYQPSEQPAPPATPAPARGRQAPLQPTEIVPPTAPTE